MRFLILSFVCLFHNLVVNAQPKAFNIVNFGAKPGLEALNTKAIQNAINVAGKSGGRIVVPPGQFVTGPIELKSGVELYLEAGAELLGSTNRMDYGPAAAYALISANGQHHVTINGKGTINGRGSEVVKSLLQLLHNGTLQDETWVAKRPSEYNRPRLIAFNNCEEIKVKNVKIKNSAGWVQDFAGCNKVTIDSVTVESTEYWNNDGIDIVNSKNVNISNCNIDAADDGICLKSEGRPGTCENIYIANCTIRSSASGFKIGTGSYGGFRNIKVRNITVYNTYRSAIALEAVDGGFIDGVDIDGVTAKYTGNAIFIRLGHRNKGTQYSSVKNIRIANLKADIPNAKPDAGYPIEGPLPKSAPHNLLPAAIAGIPGHDIENVMLENIEITYGGGASKAIAHIAVDALDTVTENESGYPEFSMFGELPAWGLYVRHAKGISFKNIKLSYKDPDFRPAVIFDDVHMINLEGLEIEQAVHANIIVLKKTDRVSFKNIKLPIDQKEAIKKLP
ncbi:glycoside hydrolase family 28 protein [Pedobacter sp. D749]|uniref:glycoside hydrolase family 28 protein n=1 Tax=Pedobacter sp. D749 TaxID=2856523 RepID=UPI001C55E517|nr:glycosyl hydrolase family 28 protein [Pedobacter sp. D749]QXU43193.1 glycoside hydrolase family 28 protein [Pedobacter sp. D749]